MNNKEQEIQMLEKWHFKCFSYSKQREYITEESQFERSIISELFELLNKQENYEEYLETVSYGGLCTFESERDSLNKKNEEDWLRHSDKMREIGVGVMEIEERKLRIRQRINEIHEENEGLCSLNQSIMDHLGFIEQTTQQIKELEHQNKEVSFFIQNNHHEIAHQSYRNISIQYQIDLLSKKLIKNSIVEQFQTHQENLKSEIQRLNTTKVKLIDGLSNINIQRESEFESRLEKLLEVNSKIFQLDCEFESLERDVESQHKTLKELKEKFKQYDFKDLDLWKSEETKKEGDHLTMENSKSYLKHLLDKRKKQNMKVKTEMSNLMNNAVEPEDCYECFDFRPGSMLELDSQNKRNKLHPSEKCSMSQILDRQKNQSSLPSIWNIEKSKSCFKNGRASSIETRSVLSCLKLK